MIELKENEGEMAHDGLALTMVPPFGARRRVSDDSADEVQHEASPNHAAGHIQPVGAPVAPSQRHSEREVFQR